MDYFKHAASASTSRTINHLMDEFGLNGYAWYFLLVELCCDNWDGKSTPEFTFHQRIVRQKLRISLAKLELFLSKTSELSSLSHRFFERNIEISMPKLLELKAARHITKSNKKQVCVPSTQNRIEENRIEENRIEENRNPPPLQDLITPDNLVDLFNEIVGPKLERLAIPLGGSHLTKAIESIGFYKTKQDWINIFEKCSESDFLMGKSYKPFLLVLSWCVDMDNIIKILEGKYENNKQQSQDSNYFKPEDFIGTGQSGQLEENI